MTLFLAAFGKEDGLVALSTSVCAVVWMPSALWKLCCFVCPVSSACACLASNASSAACCSAINAQPCRFRGWGRLPWTERGRHVPVLVGSWIRRRPFGVVVAGRWRSFAAWSAMALSMVTESMPHVEVALVCHGRRGVHHEAWSTRARWALWVCAGASM